MTSNPNDREKIAMMVHGTAGVGTVSPRVTITKPYEAFGRIPIGNFRSVGYFPIPAADCLDGSWVLSGIQLQFRTSDTGNISDVLIFRSDLVWEEKVNLNSEDWTQWDAEISGHDTGYIDLAPLCVKLVANGSNSDDFVDIAQIVCTFKLLR